MSTEFAASPPDNLSTVLMTDRLRERDWRPPDYLAEPRALTAIVSAIAQSSS